MSPGTAELPRLEPATGPFPPLVTLVSAGAATRTAIADTAETLRAQSIEGWEWLIVGADVGDVPPWAGRDGRIRVLARPQTGPALDAALATARAPAVVAVEAGDRLAPTALETWLWHLASRGPASLEVSGGTRPPLRPTPGGRRLDDGPDAEGYLAVRDDLPFARRVPKVGPRLLLVLPWLALGGSDKFVLDLLRQLRRRGWDATIATTVRAPHTWGAVFAAETTDVFALPEFLRVADYPRFLRHLVASREPDVLLVSHSEFGYLLLPYLRAHYPTLPMVDACHVVDAWKAGGFARLSVTYGGLLDRTLVTSEHLRTWMVEQGSEPERLAVCPTNVDTELWRPDPARGAVVRSELGLAPDVPVILFAGRLCPQKQPEVLAETLRGLEQRSVPWAAVVAGDGEDRAALEGRIERHGLAARVRLVGAVTNERVRDLLTAADVFFLPSAYEGVALSLYEAMACGVCVVGADVGGQSELVPPECGVLVPHGTPAEDAARYTDVLADLLSDRARCATMGAAGRTRVQAHFRLDQMGTQVDAVLRDTIARATRRTDPALAGCAQPLAEQAVATMWAAETAHRLDPYRTGWRTLAYFALRDAFHPLYERVQAWGWPSAIKQAVKDRLRQP